MCISRRNRATRLKSLCGDVDPAYENDIRGLDGLGLSRTTVAEMAALECAVHGGDIARSRDLRIDLPDPLAAHMLEAARRLAPAHIHPDLFAHPVMVPRDLSAADQLVAYSGEARYAGSHPRDEFCPGSRSTYLTALSTRRTSMRRTHVIQYRTAPGTGDTNQQFVAEVFAELTEPGPGVTDPERKGAHLPGS